MTEDYLKKFDELLENMYFEINLDFKVYQTATELIKNHHIREEYLSYGGIDRMLVGAIIYISYKINKVKMTQDRLSDKLDRTSVCLRNYIKRLIQVMEKHDDLSIINRSWRNNVQT